MSPRERLDTLTSNIQLVQIFTYKVSLSLMIQTMTKDNESTKYNRLSIKKKKKEKTEIKIFEFYIIHYYQHIFKLKLQNKSFRTTVNN